MTDPILQLKAVSKSFGAVQVLHDVDFTVRAGEVTALVGDNGAGKSTLVKCVAGIHPIDGGEILFNGEPVTINAPADAAALGLEVVYQDLALADNLDIVQNMFLGRERGKSWLLDEADMEQAARQTLASLSVRTVTSVRMPTAPPPIASAVSFAVASLMSVTTTVAPSAASFSAIPRPMPWPAPVTMATLLSSFPMAVLLRWGWSFTGRARGPGAAGR